MELAPRPGVERRAATIGGQTVAWQELGYTAESLPPEIFAYRLDTLALLLAAASLAAVIVPPLLEMIRLRGEAAAGVGC